MADSTNLATGEGCRWGKHRENVPLQAPTVELAVALFNFDDGGLHPDGSYDFTILEQAVTHARPANLLGINEAKGWGDHGRKPLQRALAILAAATGRAYVGELCDPGFPAAVIYEPTILHLVQAERRAYEDKRGFLRFAFHHEPNITFIVRIEHWAHWSGERRLDRADLIAKDGLSFEPEVVLGDFNSTASGPHLPAIDWEHLPHAIRSYKGRQGPDDRWGPDTRAVDRLIGRWDNTTSDRVGGAGFHHVAELDPRAVRPLPPTTNPRGSQLHIDHILINEAWRSRGGVVPGSYHVDIPTAGPLIANDHRRVDVRLHLTAPAGGRSVEDTQTDPTHPDHAHASGRDS